MAPDRDPADPSDPPAGDAPQATDPNPAFVVLGAPQMRVKARRFYLAGLGLLACTVWVPVDSPHRSVVGGIACIVVGLLFCAGLVAVGRGYAHTRVEVTGDAVIVHNVGTKDVFPIDEVIGFDTMTRTAGGLPGVPTGLLRLTPRAHGIPRRFPVTALTWGPNPQASRAPRPGDQPFQFDAHWDQLLDIVDDLNEAIDVRRGGTPAADRLKTIHRVGSLASRDADHGRARRRSVAASSTTSSPTSG